MRFAGTRLQTRLQFWLNLLFASVLISWASAGSVSIEVKEAASGQPIVGAKAEPKITVADPSAHEPVTVGIATDRPSARPGDIVEVVVKARIADGHHIYSANLTNPKSFTTATSVQLALPDGIEALSDWSIPAPTHVGAEWIFTNEVVYRRTLKVRADASSGPLPIKGEVRCQACNDELCGPPKDIPFSTKINIETPSKGTP